MYHKVNTKWGRYQQVTGHQSVHNTRRSTMVWYNVNYYIVTGEPPVSALPATMDIDPLFDDTLFHVSISHNGIPTPLPPPLAESENIIYNEGSPAPHSFYNQLLQ